MALDINRVVIIGRLTRDPEVKALPSGANIAKFSIAVNRKFSSNNEVREEVSYFNCVAWGKLADIVRQYCTRGKQVGIDGRLRQNRWQDQSGQNKSAVEIVVENLELLGRFSDQDASKENSAFSGSSTSQVAEPGNIYDESPDMLDDDIPF